MFDALVTTAVDGIIIIDGTGTVRTYNPACERLFGFAADEVVGKNVKMLMPEPFRGEHDGHLANYNRTGEKRIIGIGREVTGQRKDGTTFPMYLSVGEGAAAGERIFVGIIHDLTVQKWAENALREREVRLQTLQTELLHVTRVNAMGQMSSAIAHELNQPLTASANYISAARRFLQRPDGAAQAQDAMEQAGKQILRAGTTIRNLRDFIEKREGHRAPENLSKIIEQGVALAFAGMAHVNVKVRLQLEPSLPTVFVDRIQIQQVLVNLIRNAIEAMQDSVIRDLTISTGQSGDAYVSVTVRDSGPGLPEEVRRRLFQPFVTTKQGGMGVGLMLCQSIIQFHGGSIEVSPAEESGTSFCFRLPVEEQLAKRVAEERS
jgi:two-component system sensor kinase FixL